MSRTRKGTTRGTFSFDFGTPSEGVEVIIHFTSRWYYDPGRTYGDPYYCYPPESDDERTLDYVEIIIEREGERITLRADEKTGQALFDKYEREIYEVELECEPDYCED